MTDPKYSIAQLRELSEDEPAAFWLVLPPLAEIADPEVREGLAALRKAAAAFYRSIGDTGRYGLK